MTTKELRDGNIVLHNRKWYILDPFDIYKLDTTNCEDIEPIELTEEIKIMLHENNHIAFENDRVIIFTNNQDLYLKNNYKYLHQLQNLYFALTGEELEIKL